MVGAPQLFYVAVQSCWLFYLIYLLKQALLCLFHKSPSYVAFFCVCMCVVDLAMAAWSTLAIFVPLAITFMRHHEVGQQIEINWGQKMPNRCKQFYLRKTEYVLLIIEY